MNNRPMTTPQPTGRPAQTGVSRLVALIGVVVLAGAGALGWNWWSHRQAGDNAAGLGSPAGAASAPAGAGGAANRRFGAANRVQPVSVASVRSQDLRVVLNAIGNIAALNTAVVRTKVDGELRAIRFKEGQVVRAGQVLAEIDPRNYEIQLAQAQGQLTRDQAQLRNAELDLARYKDLLAKDSIARQQVDTQDALVRQLAGTVQTDQAAVDNAKLQLSYTKVTAPISGRLGLKLSDLGNVVHASDAAGLVSITQTQPISVVFAVPEANLAQISRKLKAGEPMVVEAWDREQKVRQATGRVSTTDNAIDASTGTIKLKAEFPNADGLLFPNQFVNIRLQVDTLAGALTVPASAVQRGTVGTFVYVVKEDGTVTVRRIRMGAAEGDLVSVQGELAVGDKVVTDGADRLREGAKVEVIAAPAARPGAGAASAPAAASSGTTTPRAGKPAAADAPAKPAAPDAAAKAPAAADTSDRPPFLDRLPPEVQERYLKMNPEQRKAFIEQLRERRRQREQSGNN
jgi:multidrug efflux system membrane fusion protein